MSTVYTTGMQLTRPLSHKPQTVSIHHFECLNSCPSEQTGWSLENWSHRKTVIMPKYIHEPQEALFKLWLDYNRFFKININNIEAPVRSQEKVKMTERTSSTEMGKTIRLKDKTERQISQQKYHGDLWTLRLFNHMFLFFDNSVSHKPCFTVWRQLITSYK